MISLRLPRTFGLRTLLLAMLVCAIALTAYRNRPRRPEFGVLNRGMTQEQVLDLVGKPDSTAVAVNGDGEFWHYVLGPKRRLRLGVGFYRGRVTELFAARSPRAPHGRKVAETPKLPQASGRP